MSSLQRIIESLKRIRRLQSQRWFLSALRASLWVTVIGLVVGALVLALAYHPALRAGLLTAFGLVVVGVWGGLLVRPFVRTRRNPFTARLLEGHFSHLRNDISSSLEFGQAISGGDGDNSAQGSRQLMRALIERTADRLIREEKHLEQKLPRRDLTGLRRAAVGSAAVFVLIFLVAPDLAREGLTRVFSGPTPVKESLLTNSARTDEPLVSRIEVRYRYPAYTRRGEMAITNPTGRIEVLAGTEVTLRAESLIDARSAALVLRTGEADGEPIETEIDMQIVGRQLEVGFTPLQNATYTFLLVDTERQRRQDPIRRAITVIPDAPPQAHVITPDSVVEAAPDDVIPFRFTVSDDFGLTELAFVHAFAGSPDLEQRIPLLSVENELVLQEMAAFDLAELSLQPRDELVVYVEGVDNDSVNGPKAGRSRPILIRITSAEDRHLALVEREEEIFEKLLEVLGDYLENPIADMRVDDQGLTFHLANHPPPEFQRRYHAARSISQKVLELLGAMRALLALMEGDDLLLIRDFELFQGIYERTYEHHRDEQNILTGLGRPANRGTLGRHQMQRLDQVRVQQVDETERDVLLLEEMVASQRMESLQRTMDELGAARERLRDLLEQYRETNDPELRRAIEQELLRLEARMQELLQRLSELMEQLPAEHYNVEALQQMGEMGDPQQMANLMRQIREAIDSGDLERALEMLDNLAAEMEAMMQQLGESQQSGGSGLNELDQRMSELFDEINNLEAQEGAIEQETAELQEAIRQRRVEALEEMLDSFVADLSQRVAEMREDLDEVERDNLRRHINEGLDRADDELESLQEMLEAEDFEASLDRAERALERLTGAGANLRSASRRYSPESERGEMYEDAESRVADLEDRAREVVEELDEMMNLARPNPEPSDRPQMQQLAESQQRTLQELEALQERLGEMSQDMPMLGEELQPGLEDVQRMMQGAEQRLQQGQLQGARQNEQEALQRLRQMREQMQQMVQQQRMGPQQRMSQERVEIPEEPDVTPAEFREDILDAMREESLDAYREAIRRYYESLVE